MKAIPYSVFLEVTGRCNQHCQHCRWRGSSRDGGELSTRALLGLLDELAGLGTDQVVLTGGEPTLRRDLAQLVNRAHALGQRCLLATNGSLLTSDLARGLRQAGLDAVQVSLDGSTPEAHDRFRGASGAFESALSAVHQCVSIGLSVQASMTVTAANAHDIAGVADLCRCLGVPLLRLRRLVGSGAARRHAGILDISPSELRSICDCWVPPHGDYRRTAGLRVEMEQAPFLVTRSALSEAEPLSGRILGGCSAGIALCVVDPVGNIRPCPSVGMDVGNIRETRFTDIWSSSDVLCRLRDRGNLSGKCGVCSYRQHCGGCRGDAHARTGYLFAEDPKCWHDDTGVDLRARALCGVG
jgi:AdoMet-dependent heme synthase